MLEYIAHNGAVVREPHHTNINPIQAVLFVESTDVDFDPGFRINVNGDRPIPITGGFQSFQQIVGDYQPRQGGGQDAEDIKDILSKLEWTGYAYIHEGPLQFGIPRLLLVSHNNLVDSDPLWREISTTKLKDIINQFYTGPKVEKEWK
ncbi:hypothetical protein pETSU_148 [Edwardsiella phage pEt-SU]|uniref:Uncharacterized protein n=1 Tax=Edwardsiella phage pEt-SU TaxID=2562142 RepID=A0A4D6DYI5_9CAUD|nr:hypothetical protein HOV39_gp148 [Edwardsiella phage pEt-SU]QBZ70729.1 hypothetical protein pETSU_148 [Edwardsiella phage pEt-SU]